MLFEDTDIRNGLRLQDRNGNYCILVWIFGEWVIIWINETKQQKVNDNKFAVVEYLNKNHFTWVQNKFLEEYKD